MADNKVSIGFGADIRELNSGVDEVKDKIKEVGESTKYAAESGDVLKDKLIEIGSTLAETFAVEKVLEFGRQIAELGEQLERTSQLTGLTTDAIQEFNFAVRMGGGDTEGASMSLLMLERNIDKARSGVGPAAEAFKNLGININQELPQILDQLAEKFNQMPNGAEKVDYARTIMARGFRELIPYFNEGKAGLDKLRQALDETGAKLSETKVKGLDEAAKSAKTMDTAIQGLKQTLVDDGSLRGFYDMVTKLAEAASRAAKAFKEWADAPIPGVDSPDKSKASRLPGGSLSSAAPPDQNQLQASLNQQLLNDKGLRDQLISSGAYKAPPPLTGTNGGQDNNAAQIAKEQLDTQVQLARIALQQQKDFDDEAVAAGKLSKLQELKDLQAYAALEYQVEQEALDNELALYKKGSVEYQAVLDKKEILTAQYNAKITKFASQEAQANQQASQKIWKDYQQIGNLISRDFDSMLSGILQGTQTVTEAMARLFDDMAISIVEAIAKIIVEWLLFEIATEGQGTWDDFVAINGGGGGGGGGGFLGGLLKFDTGTPYVPNDMIAQIHQGEMIIPAQQAQSIRDGGSMGGGGNYSITINAVDSQSVANLLKSNSGVITKIVNQQQRNFAMRPAA